MESYWITTWAVPIIASIVGGAASQLILIASNERLTKKLEWATLALSKDAESKHKELLKAVVNNAEARLLAIHYAPQRWFYAAFCVLPFFGFSMGLPTDEPLLAQTANRVMFLFICIYILFATHKSFTKHRALIEYFQSPSSRNIREVPFEELDYSKHLNWRGVLGVIGLTGPIVAIAFFTYLIDTGNYPSPDWVTIVMIFYFSIGFTVSSMYLPTGTQIAYRDWSDTLINRTIAARRSSQTRFNLS